ncbi:MAG TPA: VOC family protein [Solirubrobacteraceae bacterium]|nr:VOC family protein [Solirubrobacteraceae bacterium]
MSAGDRVTDLVPFVHVADVDRSVGFYELLGFALEAELRPQGRRIWAFLERGDARIMVASADAPVDPAARRSSSTSTRATSTAYARAPARERRRGGRDHDRRAGPGPPDVRRRPPTATD